MALTRRGVLGGMVATAASTTFPRLSAAADGATVRVGMVLPVTGPGADAGRFALDGAKLALADVNKAGGVSSASRSNS